jgi:hypothetical protein
MNIIKQLNGLSARLNELIEDLDRIMDYIDNNELYNEIDNNVKSQLENAVTHLDIAVDDLNDGMYEDTPVDEEDLEEWD